MKTILGCLKILSDHSANRTYDLRNARVAQLVEPRGSIPEVLGSIPIVVFTQSSTLISCCLLFCCYTITTYYILAVHSSQFCSADKNSTSKCENSESISFSWSYYIVFLLSQAIAGAGGAPIFSLCIAYLDENVSPKHTNIFIAIYYISGFLGPSLGFVVAGQLLSTYVDIHQVSVFIHLSPAMIL